MLAPILFLYGENLVRRASAATEFKLLRVPDYQDFGDTTASGKPKAFHGAGAKELIPGLNQNTTDSFKRGASVDSLRNKERFVRYNNTLQHR